MIDRKYNVGLCRGLVPEDGKIVRCMEYAMNLHLTPTCDEWFLCDDCEAWMIEQMGRRKIKAVRYYIVGGRKTTG